MSRAAAQFVLAFASRAYGLDLRIDASESALREALRRVAAVGGGTITFSASNATIGISDRIEFRGNGLVLDGEKRSITFRYTGPDDCSQKEGQDPFIEIFGDRNVIRNFTLERFPDGVHVLSGRDNVIENLRFPKVCEDAVTNNGRGYEAFGTLIRNCYFAGAEDKAVMINNGGSATVEGCEFVDCQQPVRAGGKTGSFVVRKCFFRGRSTGPQFNGGMTIQFENNVVEGAAKGGVFVRGQAQADLGGGSVAVHGTAQASPGGNPLVQNEPADLINETQGRISAKHNQWDHATASAVMSTDVRGLADVQPIGSK